MSTIDIKGKSLNELAALCHSIAVEKGFWEKERNMGEALMLIVTELADTFIRLLDLCGGLGIDIEQEIAKKSEKNKSRPYKHGKIC